MIPSVQQLSERFTQLITSTSVNVSPPLPTPGASSAVADAAPVSPLATDAAPATPAAAPAPTPVQTTDHSVKGYHLDVTVLPGQVVPAATTLDEHGFALDSITGVDWIAQGQMEVVYDYFHPASPLRVVIRARITRDVPEIPTISTVFPGANWHEREAHDFFGIRFIGHPDLSPFLLPEDADYHPLRKDFTA